MNTSECGQTEYEVGMLDTPDQLQALWDQINERFENGDMPEDDYDRVRDALSQRLKTLADERFLQFGQYTEDFRPN